ncbi:hypothetical protein MML48_5g00020797 [Holotrichia oblita]|uniref:Uncharacterized protein n=1 Tax=Holotrichia oblita TaxID=644536 RepID=A0ACB9T600_HOLOL|nr:hypothetical protein MML48_5g00020797 [Holotrichia oblita]
MHGSQLLHKDGLRRQTVPGQCCPKYEHCPAIGKSKLFRLRTWYITNSIITNLEPTSGKSSPKPDTEDHETTTKSYVDPATNTSAENEIAETTLTLEKDENLLPSESTTTSSVSKLNLNGQVNKKEEVDDANVPKITIHEIIPEVKEITEPPKQENTSIVQGQLLVEEKVPVIHEENHTNDVEDDATLESSELSEVFQHPPPVLRIGDKLLFLNKGELLPEKGASTPSAVFTIIGAEGLQRGDIESMEHHELPKEVEVPVTEVPKPPISSTTITAEIKNDSSESDKIEKEPSTVAASPTSNSSDASVTDPSQVASDNNLKTDDNTTIDVAVELASGNFEDQSQEVENKTDSPPTTSSTEIPSTSKKPIEDDQKIKIEEIVQLENPAYPPIPDIMSQQGAEYVDHNIEIVENTSKDNIESSTVDSKILPDVLPFRRNGTELQNATHTSWLKSDDNAPLINEKAALPAEILKEVAASDLESVTTEIMVTTTTTTSENPVLKSGKRSSELAEDMLPIEGFKGDDLLKYGAIVDKDSLLENQVKKLAADDDDMIGLASTLSREKSRSTESLESSSADISGENTTPKGALHVSLASNEDASIEGYPQDNTKATSSSEETISIKNGTDVEIIDPSLIGLNTSHTNTTHEENSKEFHQDRVEKRTINRPFDPESEKIFQELDSELHLLDGSHASGKDTEEEKKEAEIIFKELLDEVNASTSKTTPTSGGKNADSDVLQRVSDAIAKFQLKEARQSLDVNILGILRDFFTSQYKSYKDI